MRQQQLSVVSSSLNNTNNNSTTGNSMQTNNLESEIGDPENTCTFFTPHNNNPPPTHRYCRRIASTCESTSGSFIHDSFGDATFSHLVNNANRYVQQQQYPSTATPRLPPTRQSAGSTFMLSPTSYSASSPITGGSNAASPTSTTAGTPGEVSLRRLKSSGKSSHSSKVGAVLRRQELAGWRTRSLYRTSNLFCNFGPHMAPLFLPVLKLRGLPYFSNVDHIKKWFGEFKDSVVNFCVVPQVYPLSSGFGIVLMNNSASAWRAWQSLHRKNIVGNRFVEVFGLFPPHCPLYRRCQNSPNHTGEKQSSPSPSSSLQAVGQNLAADSCKFCGFPHSLHSDSGETSLRHAAYYEAAIIDANTTQNASLRTGAYVPVTYLEVPALLYLDNNSVSREEIDLYRNPVRQSPHCETGWIQESRPGESTTELFFDLFELRQYDLRELLCEVVEILTVHISKNQGAMGKAGIDLCGDMMLWNDEENKSTLSIAEIGRLLSVKARAYLFVTELKLEGILTLYNDVFFEIGKEGNYYAISLRDGCNSTTIRETEATRLIRRKRNALPKSVHSIGSTTSGVTLRVNNNCVGLAGKGASALSPVHSAKKRVARQSLIVDPTGGLDDGAEHNLSRRCGSSPQFIEDSAHLFNDFHGLDQSVGDSWKDSVTSYAKESVNSGQFDLLSSLLDQDVSSSMSSVGCSVDMVSRYTGNQHKRTSRASLGEELRGRPVYRDEDVSFVDFRRVSLVAGNSSKSGPSADGSVAQAALSSRRGDISISELASWANNQVESRQATFEKNAGLQGSCNPRYQSRAVSMFTSLRPGAALVEELGIDTGSRRTNPHEFLRQLEEEAYLRESGDGLAAEVVGNSGSGVASRGPSALKLSSMNRGGAPSPRQYRIHSEINERLSSRFPSNITKVPGGFASPDYQNRSTGNRQKIPTFDNTTEWSTGTSVDWAFLGEPGGSGSNINNNSNSVHPPHSLLPTWAAKKTDKAMFSFGGDLFEQQLSPETQQQQGSSELLWQHQQQQPGTTSSPDWKALP